jgi:hypothetical protein
MIKLIKKAREQEAYVLKLKETLEQMNISLYENKTYQYQRAKLIGMMDMLDVLRVDRSEFNWIFNY